MAFNWTSINNSTKITNQILSELSNNLRSAEDRLGISSNSGYTQPKKPLTGGVCTPISSKYIINIYRRTSDAYFLKNGSMPTFNYLPKTQGQVSNQSITELRNIINNL